jgi:hypothetical protein
MSCVNHWALAALISLAVLDVKIGRLRVKLRD